jgi:hypothetical protein
MLDTVRAMSFDAFLYIIGPILLGAALLYGIIMWRRRSAASKVRSDEATRRLYKKGAEEERRRGEA